LFFISFVCVYIYIHSVFLNFGSCFWFLIYIYIYIYVYIYSIFIFCFFCFYFLFLLLFSTRSNKCTIISQIITLVHVSTLSCLPQGACNQYRTKLHKNLKCSLLVVQFTIKIILICFTQVLTIVVKISIL